MSFEGSSYWFVYPNGARIFLLENSNGLERGIVYSWVEFMRLLSIFVLLKLKEAKIQDQAV